MHSKPTFVTIVTEIQKDSQNLESYCSFDNLSLDGSSIKSIIRPCLTELQKALEGTGIETDGISPYV